MGEPSYQVGNDFPAGAWAGVFAGEAPMGSFFAPLPPPVAPFLLKCYDLVSDPETDSMISWSETKKSLVIWDGETLAKEILPKLFKHDNISSFTRQLNSYGFRKVNHDRLEFACEGFISGQKHLLKHIKRKKSSQQQISDQIKSHLPRMEFGKFALEEELETLKRDKDLFMQEVIKLRQQELKNELELLHLKERLQTMDEMQQQMMSSLAMFVESPDTFAKFVQQDPGNWWRTNAEKKRRLSAPAEGVCWGSEIPSDRHAINCHPTFTENLRPSVVQEPNPNFLDSVQTEPGQVDIFCTDVFASSQGANIPLTPEIDIEALESSDKFDPQLVEELMSELERSWINPGHIQQRWVGKHSFIWLPLFKLLGNNRLIAIIAT